MKNCILIFVSMGLFFSCSSDNNNGSNTNSSREFRVSIHPKVNENTAQVNRYYHLKNGDSIYFSRLDFYIQTLSLKDRNKNMAKLDTVFLFSNNNLENKLVLKSSSLPSNIDTVNFLCGLGDLTNSLDPIKFEADHPLSSYKNMYWTMGSKYRFIVFEGMIKASTGQLIPFSYHTGLGYKYFANFPVNITLDINNPKTYTLSLHLDRIFYPLKGTIIDYKNSETQAHGDASDGPLTDKVALNFANAFSLE